MKFMKNPVVRYGIISGIILSVYVIIVALTLSAESNMTTSEITGNLLMFATFCLTIFLGIRKLRDNNYGGVISFGKVFVKGLLITLLASSLYSLTWTVFTSVSDIDFGKIIIEMTIREMQEDGAGDEEIALTIKSFEEFMPYYEMPLIKFVFTIIEPLFPGLVASLLMGFILKKKAAAIQA